MALAAFIEAKSIDLNEFNREDYGNSLTTDNTNSRARAPSKTPDLGDILSSPLIQSILSNKTIQAVLSDPMVNSVLKNSRVQKVLRNPIVYGILMSNSVDDIKGVSLLQLLLSRMTGIDQKNVSSSFNRPGTVMGSIISSIGMYYLQFND